MRQHVQRLIQAYYLASPLFLLLDAWLGLSIRASFLDGYPAYKLGYYGGLFLLGLLVWQAPATGPLVAMVESAATLAVLLLAIAVPVLLLPEQVMAGGDIDYQFGVGRIVNVMLSGTILIAAFQRSQARLAGRLRPGSRPGRRG